MDNERIHITISKSLNIRCEEYLKKLGANSNFSGLVSDALEYYLKLRGGIPEMIRKRELEK